MTCKLCGQCCEKIIVPGHQTHDWYRAFAKDNRYREDDRVDAVFVTDNWELIRVQRDRENNDAVVALMYRCKLLGPDKRCTIYSLRPPVCRGFPTYEGRVQPGRVKLHPGCGYATTTGR